MERHGEGAPKSKEGGHSKLIGKISGNGGQEFVEHLTEKVVDAGLGMFISLVEVGGGHGKPKAGGKKGPVKKGAY
jgi:hypothetical protein